MYSPPFNRVEDEKQIREMVDAARTAWIVTVGADGLPAATTLPVMWRDDTVIAHMAKANQHWKQIVEDGPVLVIIGGTEAYISPSWYAAKAEHGKVVPTWNYSAVQLTGTIRVHQDPEWLRSAVTELTEQHETRREEPWQVTDAPATYIDGQLRGIVGIEITVTGITGKAKLSQNRSEPDRRGVIAGLQAEALDLHQQAQAEAVAEDMAKNLPA